MARTKLHFRGEKELIRQLRAAQTEVLHDLAPFVQESANDALAGARKAAPVDTGRLRASGKLEPVAVNEAESVASAVVSFAAEHPAFVHESRKKNAKSRRRFLGRAVGRVRRAWKRALLSEVEASLARIFREKT